MTTGTGLDAQLGIGLETTVGTPATADTFLEFNSEGISFDPGYIEPTGLRVGVKYKRGSRLVQSRNMGLLWKLCLGSSVTTPTVISGAAYKQSHQTGDLVGKSATIQVGRPEPTSPFTVKPHTYSGCKVTSWEFSVSDNEVAKLNLEVDGWSEATATALATASFVTSEEFNFSDVTSFSLGGTIGGTTELTYNGGTAVASGVKSLSLKGDNALATERFGLGNGGTKKEQLENGTPTITGTLDAEYNQSEFYTPFKAGTATSMLVRFVGSAIGATGEFNTLEFIIPEIRIKKVTPQVSGPDIVQAQVEFEVYSNGTNNPFQVKLISEDSTAL